MLVSWSSRFYPLTLQCNAWVARLARNGVKYSPAAAEQILLPARSTVEAHVSLLLDKKIDEILGAYWTADWLPQTPTASAFTKIGLATLTIDEAKPLALPSPIMESMISFLNHALELFVGLPPQSQQDLHARAALHIADFLVGVLMNDSIKKFNMTAIRNFDNDVRHVEAFVKRLSTPQNALITPFAEVRQLLNLILSDNIEEFAKPEIRKATYPRLAGKVAMVVMILTKFKAETGGVFGMFGNKAEKNKGRAVENLLLILRPPQ
jgi:hypothetical protein